MRLSRRPGAVSQAGRPGSGREPGFPLLSDSTGDVAKAYGALWKLGPIRFARRRTFLIDPAGRVVRSFRGMRPREHAERALQELQLLQTRGAEAQRGTS